MALPLQQKLFFGTVAVGFLLMVIELVRRRRLAEEFSLLWILAGVAMVVLVLKADILAWITSFAGAALPTSVLLFGGFFFCLLVMMHLSIRLSDSARQVRRLAQELALFRAEMERRGETKP